MDTTASALVDAAEGEAANAADTVEAVDANVSANNNSNTKNNNIDNNAINNNTSSSNDDVDDVMTGMDGTNNNMEGPADDSKAQADNIVMAEETTADTLVAAGAGAAEVGGVGVDEKERKGEEEEENVPAEGGDPVAGLPDLPPPIIAPVDPNSNDDDDDDNDDSGNNSNHIALPPPPALPPVSTGVPVPPLVDGQDAQVTVTGGDDEASSSSSKKASTPNKIIKIIKTNPDDTVIQKIMQTVVPADGGGSSNAATAVTTSAGGADGGVQQVAGGEGGAAVGAAEGIVGDGKGDGGDKGAEAVTGDTTSITTATATATTTTPAANTTGPNTITTTNNKTTTTTTTTTITKKHPYSSKASKRSPGRPRKEKREYYAVRVGYVICPTCCENNTPTDDTTTDGGSGGCDHHHHHYQDVEEEEEDANNDENKDIIDDGISATKETNEEKNSSNSSNNNNNNNNNNKMKKSPIVSVIRSAIFLRWEDVQQFMTITEGGGGGGRNTGGGTTNNDDGHASGKSATEGGKDEQVKDNKGEKEENSNNNGKRAVIVPAKKALAMEYRVFDSLEKAENYLRIAMPSSDKGRKKSAASLYKDKDLSKKLKKKKKATKHKLVPRRIPIIHRPTSEKWYITYNEAKEYKETKGHLHIAQVENRSLYTWLAYQRSQYKLYKEDKHRNKHTLNEEKVKMLEELGFGEEVVQRKRGRPSRASLAASEGGNDVVDEAPSAKKTKKKRRSLTDGDEDASGCEDGRRKPRKKWLVFLEKMKEYHAQHGTFTIPLGATGDEKELRDWWRTQHADYRKWKESGGTEGPMGQEKVDMILALGYVFPASWSEMYARLVDYKAVHGTVKVSVEDDAELAEWVKKQKDIISRHSRGISAKVTEEQLSKLADIGLGSVGPRPDKAYDAKWNEMLEQMKAYKQLNGHCNVPTTSGTELGNWVMAQRRHWNRLSQGKVGKKRIFLDARKIQKLTQLGFQFAPKGGYVPWEDRIRDLREFRDLNGHCRVPIAHPGLGDWVSKIRRDYKLWKQGDKSSMTEERERELMELGFVFEAGKTPERRGQIKSWEERFEDLKAYKEQHGHTVVPQNAGALGQWVHAQRVNYKKIKQGKSSSLSAEKALKLAEIGFVFNASDRSFRGRKQKQEEEDEDINNITNNVVMNMNTNMNMNMNMNNTATAPNNNNLPPTNYYYNI